MSRQVVAVALQTVREDVARTTENYELSRDRSCGRRRSASVSGWTTAVKAAEDSAEILDRDRVTLGLIALAGFERDTILARVRERTISSRLADQILLGRGSSDRRCPHRAGAADTRAAAREA